MALSPTKLNSLRKGKNRFKLSENQLISSNNRLTGSVNRLRSPDFSFNPDPISEI
jgi:hypothetical protein